VPIGGIIIGQLLTVQNVNPTTRQKEDISNLIKFLAFERGSLLRALMLLGLFPLSMRVTC
jgi:hypothetical protein